MHTSKILFYVAIFAIAASSCSKQDSTEEKRAKLEKLKANQAQLNQEIQSLEEELTNAGVDLNDKQKIINVGITTINTGLFEHYIDVQGTVDGDESSYISAKVPAVVTKVLVTTGAVVKPGQVLAELDAEAIRKQIDALEVNVKLANEVFEKQKSLWEQQIGSEIQFKQAKANMESLKDQLGSLKEQLKMYKITSSVYGFVDMVNIKVGQLAAPGVPAFSIVNNNKLKVKANVSEAYASKIKEGNLVLIHFPDINKTLKSKIKYSGKGINTINRTIGVEVDLPDNPEFIPNMIAQLKIVDYTNTNAIVVPVNAIQFSGDSKFVFVAENVNGKKIARRKEVVLGKTYNDLAEIVSGLKQGDSLITIGYADLNDGDAISF